MNASVARPGSAIVPMLRYRDVERAIDWLCNAFAFEKHHVVSGDDGAIHYAEITFGNGMVMIGPVEAAGPDNFMTHPADAGGLETQICYLFVGDVAEHCARAKQGGAQMVLDIDDADSNGRGYSCRDLEGHIWNFGSYDPWRRSLDAPEALERPAGTLRRGLRRTALAACLVVFVIASAMTLGWAMGLIDPGNWELKMVASTGVAEAATPEDSAQRGREPGEQTIKDLRDQLAWERSAREAAERLARSARDQLTQERTAREAAERGLNQFAERRSADEVDRLTQEAKEKSSLIDRPSEAAQEQLAEERKAREVAELAAAQARQQLANERAAREAAAHAAKEAREREAKERAKHAPPRPSRPATSWQQPTTKRAAIMWEH